MSVAAGDKAPEFTLPASGGRSVSSAELRGRPYLLYFYPKADTPGCTVQAAGMEEALPGLEGMTVIAVSPDPMGATDKFAAKHGLTFPLASGADHAVAEAWGTWVGKSMHGKTCMGMERTSFLVDGDGVVRQVWRKVKPAEHAAQVRRAAEGLHRP